MASVPAAWARGPASPAIWSVLPHVVRVGDWPGSYQVRAVPPGGAVHTVDTAVQAGKTVNLGAIDITAH